MSSEKWDDEDTDPCMSPVTDEEVASAVRIVRDATAGLRFAAQVAVDAEMAREQFMQMAAEQFDDCIERWRAAKN